MGDKADKRKKTRRAADSSSSDSDSDCDQGMTRRSKKIRSGMNAKAGSRVQSPKIWPHIDLDFQYVATPVKFAELSLEQLVAGEAKTTLNCTVSDEVQGQLRLLAKVCYWQLLTKDWPKVRSLYAAVMRGVETGEMMWDGSWERYEYMSLSSKASVPGADDKRKKGDNLFCKAYQKDDCSLQPPHKSWIGGFRSWSHTFVPSVGNKTRRDILILRFPLTVLITAHHLAPNEGAGGLLWTREDPRKFWWSLSWTRHWRMIRCFMKLTI